MEQPAAPAAKMQWQVLGRDVLGRNRVTSWLSPASGIHVVSMETSKPVIRAEIVIPTVSLYAKGEAHAMEHMVFRGTAKHPAGTIDELAMRSMSEPPNAETSPFATHFFVSSASLPAFKELFHMTVEHILTPALEQESFESEVHGSGKNSTSSGVVICEVSSGEKTLDNIKELARELVTTRHPGLQAYFAGHTGLSEAIHPKIREYTTSSRNMIRHTIHSLPDEYGTYGTTYGLSSLTLAELKYFHRYFYTPANMYIFLSGCLKESEFLDCVNQLWDILDECETLNSPAPKFNISSYTPNIPRASIGMSDIQLLPVAPKPNKCLPQKFIDSIKDNEKRYQFIGDSGSQSHIDLVIRAPTLGDENSMYEFVALLALLNWFVFDVTSPVISAFVKQDFWIDQDKYKFTCDYLDVVANFTESPNIIIEFNGVTAKKEENFIISFFEFIWNLCLFFNQSVYEDRSGLIESFKNSIIQAQKLFDERVTAEPECVFNDLCEIQLFMSHVFLNTTTTATNNINLINNTDEKQQSSLFYVCKKIFSADKESNERLVKEPLGFWTTLMSKYFLNIDNLPTVLIYSPNKLQCDVEELLDEIIELNRNIDGVYDNEEEEEDSEYDSDSENEEEDTENDGGNGEEGEEETPDDVFNSEGVLLYDVDATIKKAFANVDMTRFKIPKVLAYHKPELKPNQEETILIAMHPELRNININLVYKLGRIPSLLPQMLDIVLLCLGNSPLYKNNDSEISKVQEVRLSIQKYLAAFDVSTGLSIGSAELGSLGGHDYNTFECSYPTDCVTVSFIPNSEFTSNLNGVQEAVSLVKRLLYKVTLDGDSSEYIMNLVDTLHSQVEGKSFGALIMDTESIMDYVLFNMLLRRKAVTMRPLIEKDIHPLIQRSVLEYIIGFNNSSNKELDIKHIKELKFNIKEIFQKIFGTAACNKNVEVKENIINNPVIIVNCPELAQDELQQLTKILKDTFLNPIIDVQNTDEKLSGVKENDENKEHKEKEEEEEEKEDENEKDREGNEGEEEEKQQQEQEQEQANEENIMNFRPISEIDDFNPINLDMHNQTFSKKLEEQKEGAIIALPEAVRFHITISVPVLNFMDFAIPEISSDLWQVGEPKYKNYQLLNCALYMLNGINGPLLKCLRGKGLCYDGNFSLCAGAISGIIKLEIIDTVAPVRVFSALQEVLDKMEAAKEEEHPLAYFGLSLTDYIDSIIMDELQTYNNEIQQTKTATYHSLGLVATRIRYELTPKEARGTSIVESSLKFTESEIYETMYLIVRNLCLPMGPQQLVKSTSSLHNESKLSKNVKFVVGCPETLLSQMLKREQLFIATNQQQGKGIRNARSSVVKQLCGEHLVNCTKIYMTFDEFLGRSDLRSNRQGTKTTSTRNKNSEKQSHTPQIQTSLLPIQPSSSSCSSLPQQEQQLGGEDESQNNIQKIEQLPFENEEDNKILYQSQRVPPRGEIYLENIKLLANKLKSLKSKNEMLVNKLYMLNNRKSLSLNETSHILAEQVSIDESISSLEATHNKNVKIIQEMLQMKEKLQQRISLLKQRNSPKNNNESTQDTMDLLVSLSTHARERDQVVAKAILKIAETLTDKVATEVSVSKGVEEPLSVHFSTTNIIKNPNKSIGKSIYFIATSTLCVSMLLEYLGLPFQAAQAFVEHLSPIISQDKKIKLAILVGRRNVMANLEEIATHYGVSLVTSSVEQYSPIHKLIFILYNTLLGGWK